MSLSLLLAALIAGLAGGVHCAAMCGGFLAALSARDAQAVQVLQPARRLVRTQLGYHAGRVATYSMLGAAFGAAGNVTLGAIDLASVQRVLYAAANLLLLALAVRILARGTGNTWLARAAAPVAGRVLSPVVLATRKGGMPHRIALGAAWGLVPCTLVYSMLPLALFAGGAWQGALVMLVFGLATLPNLLGIGWLVQRARMVLHARGLRFAAAAVLIAFALAGLYRVAFLPEALGQGPFCIVP